VLRLSRQANPQTPFLLQHHLQLLFRLLLSRNHIIFLLQKKDAGNQSIDQSTATTLVIIERNANYATCMAVSRLTSVDVDHSLHFVVQCLADSSPSLCGNWEAVPGVSTGNCGPICTVIDIWECYTPPTPTPPPRSC
jgi:hypothetical protein